MAEDRAATGLEWRSRPTRIAFALWGAVALATACRRDGDGHWDGFAPLDDPMTVAVDALAPANGYDGAGSLLPATGWGTHEGDGSQGDWGSFAWVVGTEARVHLVVARQAGEVDFYGRCLPYPWDADAPLQTLVLEADGRAVASVELKRAWADLRLPLPASLPRERLVDLRLRFDHALRPPGDSRELSAACTTMAVVPRSVADAAAFLAAHAFEPSSGRVALPAHGGLRLPLPPAIRGRLRLADLRFDCPSCRLVVELDSAGSPSRRLADLGTARPSFEVPFAGTVGRASLTLRVEADGPGAGGEIALTLEELAVERRAVESRSPSVFLYVVDTLRADAIDAMPSALGLAAKAVTYTQARAPSSWTLPSVASLLTGLYPDRHGVRTGGEGRALDRLPTLASALGERGYRTVAISQSSVASPLYGVDAGFDAFYVSDQLNGTKLRSEEARGLLARWLAEGDGATPELVYLHTVDPHAPYSPQGPGPAGRPDLVSAAGPLAMPEAERLRALYGEELRHADRELGRFVRLLEWLGVFDSSFVILVGDHGEEFGEHGGLDHGRTLYDEVLRVPLLVKYPGGRWAGERITEPVSLVDLAATIFAAAAPPGLDGRPLPLPGERAAGRAVYSEIAPHRDPGTAPIDLRGWTDGRVKCLEDRASAAGGPSTFVAFDLALDPAERQPRAGEELDRCRRRRAEWDRARGSRPPAPGEATLDDEALERLRALGYVD